MLAGDFAGAFRQNWFLFLSLLYLAALGTASLTSERHPKPGRFLYGTGALIYVGVYVIWFVVRNLLSI